MIKHLINIIKILLSLLLLFSCNPKKDISQEINVYSAISTKKSVDEIIDSFPNNEFRINNNYAASGILARQILNGGSADIFISANEDWIDLLLGNKIIKPNDVRVFAKNSLVIATLKDNPKFNIKYDSLFDISSVFNNKICIADPKHVPLGRYSRQVLMNLNWFDRIKSDMILAKDAAAVINLLELGECDWAIVYKTDLINSTKLKIISKLPDSLHNKVILYIANLKSKNKNVDSLFQFFISSKSKNILKKYGFLNSNTY